MLFFLGFISYAIGIGSSSLVNQAGIIIAIIVPIFIVLIGGWRKYYIILGTLLLSILGWYLGSQEYSSREVSLDKLHQLTQGFSGSYRVNGRIDKVLYKSDFNTTYRLNIANIANKSTEKYTQVTEDNVNISVDIPNNLTIQAGDTIEYTGKINAIITFPLTGFAGYAWYNQIYGKSTVTTFKKLHTEPLGYLGKLQNWSKTTIFKGFPEDIAGIILGMTIGNIELLSSDIKKSFTQAGITHILVVSGSNIAFVIIIITNLLKYFPLSRSIHIGVVLVFVVAYGMLVGWDIPVVRAVMMGTITYLALEGGKRASSVSVLLLVGYIILLYSPLALVYDAGFGLSFMGTLGILLFYSPIEKILGKIHTPKFFKEIIGVSVSASIGSMVAVIYYFGKIPLFGIFANILISCFLGWILFSSIIYLVFSLIGGWLIYLWGWLIYLPTVYIVEVGNFFGKGYIYTIDEKFTSFISLFLLGMIISVLFWTEKNNLLQSK